MKQQVSGREKFIWNMLGSLSNALSSLILSICVNRILGGNSAGIFAFAYANAQLMLTVGGFEVRPYQSTDVLEKYSFNTYFSLRVITCAVMMAITAIYILISSFSFEKSVVVFFLAMFKMVEVFTDVYAGRFQQKDRIDLSGKTFFVRVTASTIVFIISIAVTGSLMLSSVMMFAVSALLFFVYDYRYIFEEDKRNLKLTCENLMRLVREVLPLFVGAFIMMYISNAPKYAINRVYGDEMQNIYNILFMPAFVINLFSIFVFRPMLVDMSTDWNNGNLKRLRSSILKVYGLILAFTLIALAGTWILGIPVLSLLYGIDLADYRYTLMLVMTAGGISALMTFSYYVVTVLRKQTLLLAGYAAAFIYVIFMAEFFVRKLGIAGAVLSYGTTVGILAIIFIGIIISANTKRGKNDNGK